VKKPVSTDTIKDLTESAAHNSNYGKPPTTLPFKDDIPIPDGLGMAPVLYTRISRDQNKAVYREFCKKVKPKFYKFLAQNHKQDLQKLGICDHGIERMKKGMSPANKHGKSYNVSIDHIIERAGSGKFGLEKAQDPYLSAASSPTYKVNHFNNLILMTQTVHDDVKNAINEKQKLWELSPGKSKWGFMAVPVRDANRQGFVHYIAPKNTTKHSVASKEDTAKYGVAFKEDTISAKIEHASFALDKARDRLVAFSQNATVNTATKTIENLSRLQNKTVTEVLERQEKTGEARKAKLSTIFNEIVKYDPAARRTYNDEIVPLFYEMNKVLEDLRKSVEQFPQDHAVWKQYDKIRNGRRMEQFKREASKIPVSGKGSGKTVLTYVKNYSSKTFKK